MHQQSLQLSQEYDFNYTLETMFLNQNQRLMMKYIMRKNQQLREQLKIKQQAIKKLKQLNNKLQHQPTSRQKLLKQQVDDFYSIFNDFQAQLNTYIVMPKDWMQMFLSQSFDYYQALRKSHEVQIQKRKDLQDNQYIQIIIEEIQKLEKFTKVNLYELNSCIFKDVITSLDIFKQQIPCSVKFAIRQSYQLLTKYLKDTLDAMVKVFRDNFQKKQNKVRIRGDPALKQPESIIFPLQGQSPQIIIQKYENQQNNQKSSGQINSNQIKQSISKIQCSKFNNTNSKQKQKSIKVQIGESQILANNTYFQPQRQNFELEYIDQYYFKEDYSRNQQQKILFLQDENQIDEKLKNQMKLVQEEAQKYSFDSVQQSVISNSQIKLDNKNQLNMKEQKPINSFSSTQSIFFISNQNKGKQIDELDHTSLNLKKSLYDRQFQAQKLNKKKQQGGIDQIFNQLINDSVIIDDKQELLEKYKVQLLQLNKKNNELYAKNKQISKQNNIINGKLVNKHFTQYFKEFKKVRSSTKEQISEQLMSGVLNHFNIKPNSFLKDPAKVQIKEGMLIDQFFNKFNLQNQQGNWWNGHVNSFLKKIPQ